MPKTSFAQRYLDAWNSHDPDLVLQFFNRDATYSDSGLHQQVQGGQIGRHIERILSLCPDVHFELLDNGAMGPQRAAIQWRAHGSTLHRLCPQLNTDTLDAICGLDYIFHHRGCLISTHVYFDLLPHVTQAAPSHTPSRALGYQKSGLDPEAIPKLKARLEQLMHEQQPYLQNDLTLDHLAHTMSLSRNHLSQLINSAFGVTFYEWINQYRVEHAKKLLTNYASDSNTSTLDIAFASGFGSVSAFYRAFQQLAQMTPAKFRRDQRRR